MVIKVFGDYDAVSAEAAKLVAGQILKKPDSVLGLATGSTPIGLYQGLIKYFNNKLVSFRDVKSFNLDEYVGLSPHHEASYRYFMDHQLFRHVDLKEQNIHMLSGHFGDAVGECERYEHLIEKAGGIDLQVLGIGRNGHIGFNEPADNFPGATHLVELDRPTREDNARFFRSIEEVPTHALTMGIRSIMKARKILLIATGKAKAEAVWETVEGRIRPQLPASILQLHSDVTLLLDVEAASLLSERLYVLES